MTVKVRSIERATIHRMRTAVPAVLFLFSATLAAQPANVPAEYRGMVVQIEKTLRALDRRVPKVSGPPPIYAAELLPANGNRGEQLLEPKTIEGVKIWLDRFQQLRIQGVVFAVPYPLLMHSYPRSAEYISFFREVVKEARKRQMTVEIESAVIFANSPFSPVRWDYSKITVERLMGERHEMIATIVRELAPDYLDLGAEPDTEARLTGLRELNDPLRYAQFVGGIIRGIHRGRTKIGAGFGTWSKPEFVRRQTELPLDFISLHIYPISTQTLANAIEGCRIARQHGKEILIDEAWLYKMRPGEVSDIASNAKVFARDAFSFWAPLDQRFLRFISDFARAERVRLISPFWSTFFFAYLDYDSRLAQLPYPELVKELNTIAARAVIDGRFSDTGKFYRDLIKRGAGVPPAASARLARSLTLAGRDARPVRPGRPLSVSRP
jgi:hypothetical protein